MRQQDERKKKESNKAGKECRNKSRTPAEIKTDVFK
jgi:hypothetical protein